MPSPCPFPTWRSHSTCAMSVSLISPKSGKIPLDVSVDTVDTMDNGVAKEEPSKTKKDTERGGDPV